MRDQEIVDLQEAYLSIYTNLDERRYDRDEPLPGSGKTPREKMQRKRDQHAARVMLGNPALGRSPRNDPERDSYRDRASMMDRVKASQDKGEEPRDDEGRKNLIKAARRPRASYERQDNRPGGLRAGNTKAGGHRTLVRHEEFEGDLFDYLLEYLVAEGYADTNKAALVIMANMSEEWKQSIVEAGMDMFSTPAYKKSKADAAAKVYTKTVKPLPAYGNAPRGASGPHAADAAVGTQSLIKPYNARSVVPRFPGLTLPEPDNSVPKVNIPKFPSPKPSPKGETKGPKPPVTERPKPPVTERPKPLAKVEPKVNPTKAPEKTPNPLMVDMPKGPGSMASPEKPSVPASTGPRSPISPGSFGGGVGTKPTSMSGGTSTVQGLDRSVTSGLTTKSQDETQRKAREKSALSQRVAGYKSGGPSAGVR